MEKDRFLKLVSKTSKSFRNLTPTQIYNKIQSDKIFEPFLSMLQPKDIVLYCFLVNQDQLKKDINEMYDRIISGLYAVQIAEIDEQNPEVDCSHCDSGLVNCSNCDSTGIISCSKCDGNGEVPCNYCEGSGYEDDDTECSVCEGAGNETCNNCDGNGEDGCPWCDDGHDLCDECGGSGDVPDYELTSVIFSEYISWSEGWRNNFDTYVENDIIDEDDYHNFIENNQTLLINHITLNSENYKDFEVGELIFDELIFQPTIDRASSFGGNNLLIKNFRH
jgi:hypothetical protein